MAGNHIPLIMQRLAQIVTEDRIRKYSAFLIVKIIVILKIYGVSYRSSKYFFNNSNFHKLLNYGYSQGKKTIASLYSLMILRDPLLGKGGWRNLYTAEDSEIFARIKSDYYVPAIPFINGYPSENNSESRYAKHFKYYVRRIRLGVDLIRGEGFTLDDTFNYFKFYYKANPFFYKTCIELYIHSREI